MAASGTVKYLVPPSMRGGVLTASQLVTTLHQDIISCMHRTIDLLACNFESLCLKYFLQCVSFLGRWVPRDNFGAVSGAAAVGGWFRVQQDVHPAKSNVACENRRIGLFSVLEQDLDCDIREKANGISKYPGVIVFLSIRSEIHMEQRSRHRSCQDMRSCSREFFQVAI